MKAEALLNGTYQHMLRTLNGLKADKGDLHREQGSQCINCGVRYVDTVRKPSSKN